MNSWRPTPGLLRAVFVAGSGAIAALVLSSPAVVVLIAPVMVWIALALRARPSYLPKPEATIAHHTLIEGQGTRSTLRLGDPEAVAEIEHVVRVSGQAPFLATHPANGVVGGLAATTGGTIELSPRRWGRREIPDGKVAATSAWAGFRFGPVVLPGLELFALPTAAPFRAHGEAPQPLGLVGSNRSRRVGEGTEFAGIREFHAGDRLRRVNWRVSLRTRSLHVVTTRAEEDSGVLIVVDALADHGASEGIDGHASSLDVTVRAAAALAEHHLRVGDRVALRVIEWKGNIIVNAGSGERHLRRVLGTLARIRPGDQPGRDLSHQPIRVVPGTVVFVLSPMLHESVVTVTGVLARHGLPVMVIDTLPADVRPIDESGGRDARVAELAWRMRRADREALLEGVARSGTPVVTWRGPGTLDEVLHRLARRASLPRPVMR
jgi:uncharacterized protein (DUF58 family)